MYLHKVANNNKELDELINELCAKCYHYMNDDFNTPQLIAVLFELVSKINSFSAKTSFNELSEKTFLNLKKTFNGFIEDVLGLIEEPDEKEGKTDQLIKLFLQLRAEAKESKDYELSDKIRDQLIKAGIVIKDNKEGTVYSIKE